MAFFDRPISEIVDKTKKGDLSCREVVKRALETVKEGDKELNSFICTQNDAALALAAQMDELSDDQKKNKPLLGIPIGVKDNICTKGISTTCASRMLERFDPPYDATVVEALRDSGAVVVGKTNLDEFAMGSSTESSYFGSTLNPHDPKRIPGGSSGGSAAAVGAGLVPAALGSDTGGSIRQPSSHCGAVGLKPTYGRVSRYGLVAFASSLDQIGPVANDVRDTGLLLSVISRADKRDSTCAGRPFSDSSDLYTGDVRGLRIGVPREYFGEGLSSGVRECIESLLKNLEHEGAQIVNVSLPNLQYAIATYYIICTAEASSNLARYDGVKYGFRSPDPESLKDMYMETREQGFGSEVKRRIMLGTYVLSSGYYDAYYLKAAKVRTLISKDFDNAFGSCDLVVSPVAPAPAFQIGEKSDDPLQMYLTDIYTVSANLAGIPGISVPCGNVDSLPVGVQFMAPQWREDTLLRAAYKAQELFLTQEPV
ncbi:MAG: Asp-tRNA(Asn)/Glu-tRNA(Gln) amidotransferase subunit GatA [Chitinispirillaceae bacterium]